MDNRVFDEAQSFIVVVCLTLPHLPIHFFHEYAMRSIVAPLGKFLKSDNPTAFVSQLEPRFALSWMRPNFFLNPSRLGCLEHKVVIFKR